MVLHHNYNIPLEDLHNLSKLEIKNKYGDKLLSESIITNNFERLKELIDVYSVDVNNLDLLEKACKFSGKGIIEYLIERIDTHNALKQERKFIENLFVNVILTDEETSEIIKTLIIKDIINVDKLYGAFNLTILMVLIDFNDVETIKYLLENKKYDAINIKDSFDRTALMHASKKGNSEIVDLLLQYGADPYIKNYYGKTAVDIATGHAVDVFSKRKIHPTLPEKFEMTDHINIISKCIERDDLITTYNIRELDEVYMVKQDDHSYNCYSLGEIIHIRDLKERKKLDDLERLGDFRQLTKDFDLEELFVNKNKSN